MDTVGPRAYLDDGTQFPSALPNAWGKCLATPLEGNDPHAGGPRPYGDPVLAGSVQLETQGIAEGWDEGSVGEERVTEGGVRHLSANTAGLGPANGREGKGSMAAEMCAEHCSARGK